MGARPTRRRARPPEHQGRLARLRAHRPTARLPLLRQRRDRPRPRRTTSSRASTTPSSTPSARRRTAGSAFRARICPGSWPATAFVAWYNAHPDFHGLSFDLRRARAVVVGNGNVAVDVARMLALTPEELAPTDTADAAIDAIAAAGIEEIVVLGRRGPAQAAFTTPELMELTELAGADFIVDPAELELDPASEAALGADTALARRNVERPARGGRDARPRASRRRCGSASASRRSRSSATGGSRRSRSSATGSWPTSDGSPRAVPTEEREVIPCGLVLRSVGYRGVPIPGVPFDERSGTIAEPRRPRARRERRRRAGPLLRRAGSSAGRAASSARTRRTRPRRSSSCSRMPRPGCSRRADDADVEDVLSERGVGFVPTPGGRRSTCTSAASVSRSAGPG